MQHYAELTLRNIWDGEGQRQKTDCQTEARRGIEVKGSQAIPGDNCSNKR